MKKHLYETTTSQSGGYTLGYSYPLDTIIEADGQNGRIVAITEESGIIIRIQEAESPVGPASKWDDRQEVILDYRHGGDMRVKTLRVGDQYSRIYDYMDEEEEQAA